MKKLFVGIDFSKEKIDVAIIFAEGLTETSMRVSNEFKNSVSGYKQLVKWVENSSNETEPSLRLFCGENTGDYSKPLCNFLYGRGFDMWLENAKSIKDASGIRRLKSDRADDYKIHGGYINFGKQHGGDFGIDCGFSDYLSFGLALRVVEPYVDEDGEKKLINGMDGFMTLKYHFQETLKLPSKFDFYVGAQASLFGSTGLNAGVYYNFGEVVGIYAQAERNLFDAWSLRLEDNHPFKNSCGFSAGLTFNIDW